MKLTEERRKKDLEEKVKRDDLKEVNAGFVDERDERLKEGGRKT